MSSAVTAAGWYLHLKGAFLLQQHATSSSFPQSMLCRPAVCQSKGHVETMHMLWCSPRVCHEIYWPSLSRSLSLALFLFWHFQRVFVDECKFKETLLPNNYNAYESFVYKGFYIALSKHGRVKRGNKATTAMTVTHFLPRLWEKLAITQ